MLNLAKALVYFGSPSGTNFRTMFQKHGLNVPFNDSSHSLATEIVEFQSYGVYPQMTSLYNEPSYNGLKISLQELLAQIPDLRDMYLYIYNKHPRVFPLKKTENGYSSYDIDNFTSDVISQIKDMGNIKDYFLDIWSRGNGLSITRSMAAQYSLKELGFIFESIAGIEYFRMIPKIQDNLITLQEASIHYLIVFSYGMLARYQASKWGKYIDPDLSSEAEIINKSIHVAKYRFVHFVISYIFKEKFEFRYSTEVEKNKIELIDSIYDDLMEKMNRYVETQLIRSGKAWWK